MLDLPLCFHYIEVYIFFTIQGQNLWQDQFQYLNDQKDLLFALPVIYLLLCPIYFEPS